MGWPYPYFTVKEMECPCGCKGLPKDSFMNKLVTVRELYAHPMIVSSAYRCPEYNAKVSTSGLEGPHTLGLAADFPVYGARALQLLSIAANHGMTGIGAAQKGPVKSRFLHLDSVENTIVYPRPWIWTY